jgi:thiosulfate dehydrogenase [quinone] large subunit
LSTPDGHRWLPESNDEWMEVLGMNNREVAYALLRITLGMIFMTTGTGKFLMGVGNFAAALQQEFAGKLPAILVTIFSNALPFAEVTFGALLVLGLFNRVALVLVGLLLMALTFGKVVTNDSATVAGNLVYVLIVFALLWLADYNGYSVDRLRKGSVSSNNQEVPKNEP